jgi:hypothetical protein
MSNEKFAELCKGTASMLTALAEQADGVNGEMQFQSNVVGQTISPLAEIIAEIAKAAK